MFKLDGFRMKVIKMKTSPRINTVSVIRSSGLEFCFGAEKVREG